MDSGWLVPTLNPGLREMVAEKLLTVANERPGNSPTVGRAEVCDALAMAAAEFMLERSAFFFAADKAGSSSAATSAMRAMTTMSSISVKAG